MDDRNLDRMALWAGLLVLSAVCSLLYGCGEVRSRGRILLKACEGRDEETSCLDGAESKAFPIFFSRSWSRKGGTGLVMFSRVVLGEGDEAGTALLWIDLAIDVVSAGGEGTVSGKNLTAELLLPERPCGAGACLLHGTGKVKFLELSAPKDGPVHVRAYANLEFQGDGGCLCGSGDALVLNAEVMSDAGSEGDGGYYRGDRGYYYGSQDEYYCDGCYGCGGGVYIEEQRDAGYSGHGSGCEADDGPDTESGCQGDDASYSSSSSGSGCEGDDAGSSCEADAAAAAIGPGGRRRARGVTAAGLARFLAPVLLGAALRARQR